MQNNARDKLSTFSKTTRLNPNLKGVDQHEQIHTQMQEHYKNKTQRKDVSDLDTQKRRIKLLT